MPRIVKRHFIFLSQKSKLPTWIERVGNMEEWTEKLCPQNSASAISLGENGDKQFCKEKFHAANGKAQHALMNGPIFFFLKGQGEMDFFFPPCSQCVPIMFPKGYESVPQDVPNSTCALSYMVWVKFNPM